MPPPRRPAFSLGPFLPPAEPQPAPPCRREELAAKLIQSQLLRHRLGAPWASPVSITVRRTPAAFSSATAWADVPWAVGDDQVTGVPPSTATWMTVPGGRGRRQGRSPPAPSVSGLPASTVRPSITARTPWPRSPPPQRPRSGRGRSPGTDDDLEIGWRRTCSAARSAPAAPFSPIPPSGPAATENLPWVSVPVLSKTTIPAWARGLQVVAPLHQDALLGAPRSRRKS